jgi:hypothetical protein
MYFIVAVPGGFLFRFTPVDVMQFVYGHANATSADKFQLEDMENASCL